MADWTDNILLQRVLDYVGHPRCRCAMLIAVILTDGNVQVLKDRLGSLQTYTPKEFTEYLATIRATLCERPKDVFWEFEDVVVVCEQLLP